MKATVRQLRPSVIVAISAGFLALYAVLGAKALNLDGLGYAGRVQSGDPAGLLLPGHLFYGPIMHALYRVATVFSPGVDAARLMQVADSVFAAAGVGVFIAALRRLSVGPFAAVTAGVALGVTYTYWTHATDLTTYAFSTFCLICAFYLMCGARSSAKAAPAWPTAAMVALATLIHQSNLVFLPAAMLGASAGGSRNVLKLGALSLLLICLPYAWLGSVATQSRSPMVIAKWAARGAHGYAPTFEPVNLARGVYGFANAVVYLDDAGTAIKGHAANIDGSGLSTRDLLRFACKAGFVIALVGAPSAAYLGRRKLSDEQRWAARVCVAWIAPYTLVALMFFTTDHDRWIMLLPAVATLAAVAYPNPSARGRRAAVAAVGILFALNLTSTVYPAHLGTGNRYYQEAVGLAPELDDADLVIFWGHDHMGTAGYLRQMRPVEAYHLIDMVLRRGKARALRDLTRMVSDAKHAQRRVLVIGLFGVHDRASDYLSEADSLGVTRADVLGSLSSFDARAAFPSGDGAAYELKALPRKHERGNARNESEVQLQ